MPLADPKGRDARLALVRGWTERDLGDDEIAAIREFIRSGEIGPDLPLDYMRAAVAARDRRR